jgi:type I restriction enzyme S subunit
MKSEWATVKIGEIVSEERLPVGTFDGSGFSVLGVTNVEGVTHTGIKASEDLSKYLRLKPGRFVYNPYRVNVGSLGLSSEAQDGITSPAYVIFAPGDHVEAKYLHYYLKSAHGSQLINFYGNRGSVRSALRFNDLSQIEIPLPPLEEQRRIVTRIEDLAAQINLASTLRQKAIDEAKFLINTRNQEKLGYRNFEVGNISFVTKLAGFEYTKYLAGAPEGDVLLIRAGNVKNNGLKLENAATIPSEISDQLPRSQLKPGDVVMTFIGAKIGEVTFISVNHPRLHCGPNIAKITPSAFVDQRYLVAALQSPFVQEQIQNITKLTAQPNLSMKTIRKLIIPVPPLSEQRQIVAELDALQAEVDALKRLQAETSAELDALLPSILDRAFKGEL